jgi:hypothetical protein
MFFLVIRVVQLLPCFHRATDTHVPSLDDACWQRGTEPHGPEGGVGKWPAFAMVAHALVKTPAGSAVPAR